MGIRSAAARRSAGTPAPMRPSSRFDPRVRRRRAGAETELAGLDARARARASPHSGVGTPARPGCRLRRGRRAISPGGTGSRAVAGSTSAVRSAGVGSEQGLERRVGEWNWRGAGLPGRRSEPRRPAPTPGPASSAAQRASSKSAERNAATSARRAAVAPVSGLSSSPRVRRLHQSPFEHGAPGSEPSGPAPPDHRGRRVAGGPCAPRARVSRGRRSSARRGGRDARGHRRRRVRAAAVRGRLPILRSAGVSRAVADSSSVPFPAEMSVASGFLRVRLLRGTGQVWQPECGERRRHTELRASVVGFSNPGRRQHGRWAWQLPSCRSG